MSVIPMFLVVPEASSLLKFEGNGDYKKLMFEKLLPALLRSILWTFSIFEGWLFPRHQVYLLWWVWSMELASIGGTQIEASVVVEKYGYDGKSPKMDRSSTAPSSKAFRDEFVPAY
jgi:hypothetical protein